MKHVPECTFLVHPGLCYIEAESKKSLVFELGHLEKVNVATS